MKQINLSGITFLTLIFTCVALMLMLTGSVTEMGNAAYAAVTEDDCRFCHENIDSPVNVEKRCDGFGEIICLTDADCAVGELCQDVQIKDRHHILTGAIGGEGPAAIPPASLIFDGLCSMNDTVICTVDADCPDFASGETCRNYSCSINETVLCDDDADCPDFASGETCRNDPVTAPLYPRATPTDPDINKDYIRDTIYGCNNCHPDNPTTPEIEFRVTRDCLLCHYPKNIASAIIHNGLITIIGSGFDAVSESDIVYVDKTDGSLGTCRTDVLSWSDSLIEADSWLNPDQTVCAEPGDIAVVPCAAAEKMISLEVVDLDIRQFQISNSAKVDQPIKRIQLTVENPNGPSEDMRPATLRGFQNAVEVYFPETNGVTKPVWDITRNGRARFAFPSYTPTAAGTINWTVTIADDDGDDDTATASTNVR